MKQDIVDTLSVMVKFYNDQEIDDVNLIVDRIKKNQHHGAVYESLAKSCSYTGLYAFIAEGNIGAFKQWFFVSSLLRAESCKYSGGWDMWTPHAFIFPLLTDNHELIKKYSDLTTVNDQDHYKSLSEAINYPEEGRFGVLRFQAVLRRDWDKVDKMKEIFFSKMKKPQDFELWEIEFYDALKNKDSNKAQDIIYKYLNPKVHKYLNQHLVEEFNGDIWSHHPVMFTKLAWINGLEIEINHPLVPMELMPIKPLAYYDYHYEFLDPNWKPQSFFSKLFGKN